MPKYVIPEGPSLTGSLPGNSRGGVGFGAMGVVGGPGVGGGGMGHGGRRYTQFAPAVGRSAEFVPGVGGGENNGSGRTTPSSAQVRIMTIKSTQS